MQASGLTANEYRSVLDRAHRQRDYAPLIRLIERTFSSPESLNESFKLSSQRSTDPLVHNIDFEFVNCFYYDTAVNSSLPEDMLPSAVGKLLKTVADNVQLASRYTRAYLLLLMCGPLYDKSAATHLNKLASLIGSLQEADRDTLQKWSIEIDQQRLRRLVQALNRNLGVEASKLLPDSVEKHNLKQAVASISSSIKLLELLYRGNAIKQRIRPQCFENEAINKHFDPKEQFRMHLKKQKILNFIEYPFLLGVDYKNKLLDYETQYEHQMSLERGMMNLMGGMVQVEQPINQQINAFNIMFLHFELHRANLLDESLDKLSKVKTSLKNPLKITFIGEPGDDGGGVKKEYFQLVIKEIFNPCRDMFVQRNADRFYWFNGESFEAPIMFEFVGMLLGLSIYNRTLLNLNFPELVYKKLLAKETGQLDCLAELTDIEPEFQRSFQYILSATEPLEPMELTFEAESDVFGEKVRHPLKPNGHLIKLNQSNKREYVKLYSDWLVNKSVEKQFKAFSKGFYKVVTGDMIKIFLPCQLQRIICGDQLLDFKELEKVTKYESGYSSQTPIIRALWEVVHSWSLETKKAFLFFATGSDRAPIGGLGNLRFTVERHGPDSSNLPSAHTCSNVFLLPEYSGKSKLKEKLELALKFKEGFGLI